MFSSYQYLFFFQQLIDGAAEKVCDRFDPIDAGFVRVPPGNYTVADAQWTLKGCQGVAALLAELADFIDQYFTSI